MRPDPPRRPSKPATTRSIPTGTARGVAGRPPSPPRSKTPIILACAGGGVLLLIILFVAMSGEEPARRTADPKSKAPKEEAPKRIAPDVSGLEATAKQKCDEGLRIVESRANPDSSVPKDRVRDDLEKGLILLKDGLEGYDKAAQIAGKKYDTGRYSRARNVAITLFCTDLEKEGQASCEQGTALIKSTANLLTGKELTDEEKQKLKDNLQKGKSLISAGMQHLDRVERVSGRKFDQSGYQEALLIARKKLPELQ